MSLANLRVGWCLLVGTDTGQLMQRYIGLGGLCSKSDITFHSQILIFLRINFTNLTDYSHNGYVNIFVKFSYIYIHSIAISSLIVLIHVYEGGRKGDGVSSIQPLTTCHTVYLKCTYYARITQNIYKLFSNYS